MVEKASFFKEFRFEFHSGGRGCCLFVSFVSNGSASPVHDIGHTIILPLESKSDFGFVTCTTGPARTFSRGTNQEIQWLPTTSSIKCGEPRCACNASRKENPGSCPALEGQVHLSGDTQYVRALGKIFEAGGQPVKNREMRRQAQKGNQAKFFHRMLGILQRSPVVYNLQHLREYNSCRIWASKSRRPPYVADVEGRARIEGVAASRHESYMDGHGHKVAEDAVFKTLAWRSSSTRPPRADTGRSNRSPRASIQ